MCVLKIGGMSNLDQPDSNVVAKSIVVSAVFANMVPIDFYCRSLDLLLEQHKEISK